MNEDVLEPVQEDEIVLDDEILTLAQYRALEREKRDVR